MERGTGIAGSTVHLLFGKAHAAGIKLAPANDDGVRKSVNTVTVRKNLEQSGVAIKIKVPVDEFYGVCVSTSISEDGLLKSTVSLLHGDEALTYKVYEEVGNTNIVAEWQNWGRKLRLPLYIRTGDGQLMPYSQKVGGVVVGDESGRRRLAPEANRRPRFLNRRKPGA